MRVVFLLNMKNKLDFIHLKNQNESFQYEFVLQMYNFYLYVLYTIIHILNI